MYSCMYYLKLYIKLTIRYVLKPMSFIPALVMIYLIFNFSAQTGVESSGVSLVVTEKMVRIYDVIMDKAWDNNMIDAQVERFHGRVRKVAHVTEYFILGFCVALPLYVYKVRGIWLILFACGFCVAFACLDEFHQSFVAGRSPSKRDVLIDCIGVFPGVITAQTMGYIGRKTIFSFLSVEKKRKNSKY